MEYKNYLARLRTGDTVNIGKVRSRLSSKGTIDKVTPKYIHIGGRKYSRITGEATRMVSPWCILKGEGV